MAFVNWSGGRAHAAEGNGILVMENRLGPPRPGGALWVGTDPSTWPEVPLSRVIRDRCPTRSDCLLGLGDLVGLVEPGEVSECPGTWIECELGGVQAVVPYAKCLKIAPKD